MRFGTDGKRLGGAVLLAAAAGIVMAAGAPAKTAPLTMASAAATPSAPAVSDGAVKIGKPFRIGSVTHMPADDPDYDEVGYATWYGDEMAGNNTANGEKFRPRGISAAHRTLPMPSYVEVTALDTGKTILVRINDRGPFSNDLLIDLSRGAAEQLGVTRGKAAVRVRRVNPPEQERAALRSGGRAAERMETPDLVLAALRKKLADQRKPARKVTKATPTLDYAPPPADGDVISGQ